MVHTFNSDGFNLKLYLHGACVLVAWSDLVSWALLSLTDQYIEGVILWWCFMGGLVTGRRGWAAFLLMRRDPMVPTGSPSYRFHCPSVGSRWGCTLFTASVSRLLRCPTEVSVLKSLSTILTSPQNGVEIADANRTYTIVGMQNLG